MTIYVYSFDNTDYYTYIHIFVIWMTQQMKLLIKAYALKKKKGLLYPTLPCCPFYFIKFQKGNAYCLHM